MIIPPNQAAGATANCPPDTVAISGAYHGSGAPGIFVYGNKFMVGDPDMGIPPTGWFVGAFNTGTESQAFTVWSICAPFVVEHLTHISKSVVTCTLVLLSSR